MRDLLNDLEETLHLSDPDPVKRAQLQMKTPLPKRFYTTATADAADGGFVVRLDGKTAHTPGRKPVLLPSVSAAMLVANEFDAQTEVIDPVTMPVLRLVNTAIDGVAQEIDAVAEDVLRFASSDLLCYRAHAPEALVERQNAAWDPVLDWCAAVLGARFEVTVGVVHVTQPREAMQAINLHLRQHMEPFRLASLHSMTSLTGSALLALAVHAGEIDAETAWSAAHVDEDWQVEHWGQDAEAAARRELRKKDMMAAVALLAALS